jgi:hypothetical protein
MLKENNSAQWDKIRDRFFDECTQMKQFPNSDGVVHRRVVYKSPQDIFMWYKDLFENDGIYIEGKGTETELMISTEQKANRAEYDAHGNPSHDLSIILPHQNKEIKDEGVPGRHPIEIAWLNYKRSICYKSTEKILLDKGLKVGTIDILIGEPFKYAWREGVRSRPDDQSIYELTSKVH